MRGQTSEAYASAKVLKIPQGRPQRNSPTRRTGSEGAKVTTAMKHVMAIRPIWSVRLYPSLSIKSEPMMIPKIDPMDAACCRPACHAAVIWYPVFSPKYSPNCQSAPHLAMPVVHHSRAP